jgi:hypothetical protein
MAVFMLWMVPQVGFKGHAVLCQVGFKGHCRVGFRGNAVVVSGEA